MTAMCESDDSGGAPSSEATRKASAKATRIAASPALKRKNFTPASLETNASVKAMPTPRWARKKKRTVERDMGRIGRIGRIGSLSRPTLAQPLVDFVPVDHVPPRVEVVGTAVLVLQ